jgi:hypothetical protein
LAADDPLRHITIQILQFSLSFEAEPIAVKKILLETVNHEEDIRAVCENYASMNGYRNLDHLFEWLVFESPFAALVIIDSVPENLEMFLPANSSSTWRFWRYRAFEIPLVNAFTTSSRSLQT